MSSNQEDIDVDAIRKKIGLLSADRDCLRYLLKEEKQKNNKTFSELREENKKLTLRLEALASIVVKLKRFE